MQCGDEQGVLDYFETNFIDELRRGKRLAPRFPRELWNMHVRVENNLHRTNIEGEGWHNRFANSFRHHHAHMWKFIDGLKRDSAFNHMAMAQQIIGIPNAPHRLLYREVNQRIQTLVAGYNIENIIFFLRGISFNMAQ